LCSKPERRPRRKTGGKSRVEICPKSLNGGESFGCALELELEERMRFN
jgi:hypothetical protein